MNRNDLLMSLRLAANALDDDGRFAEADQITALMQRISFDVHNLSPFVKNLPGMKQYVDGVLEEERWKKEIHDQTVAQFSKPQKPMTPEEIAANEAYFEEQREKDADRWSGSGDGTGMW